MPNAVWRVRAGSSAPGAPWVDPLGEGATSAAAWADARATVAETVAGEPGAAELVEAVLAAARIEGGGQGEQYNRSQYNRS